MYTVESSGTARAVAGLPARKMRVSSQVPSSDAPCTVQSSTVATTPCGRIIGTNLIRPGQDHRSGSNGLQRARDQVVDVVEGVRDQQARRQGPSLPARPEVEHLGGHPWIAAEHRLELDPLDATRVAEISAHGEHAPTVVGAEGEELLGTEGQHGVVREVARVEKEIGDRAGQP